MKTVWAGELLELSTTDDGRGAWIARTARSIGDGDTGELERLRREIEALPASCVTVVADLRLAPGRNDAAFEGTIVPAFRAITSRFPRQAMLVRTAVGKMQVRRLESIGGVEMPIFTDEDEARRFLTGAR